MGRRGSKRGLPPIVMHSPVASTGVATMCGRASINVTHDRSKVTCARCKLQLEAFDLVAPEEGWRR